MLQWTGIPVSVGIAPTKTLAKVANHAAKKDQKHGGAVLLLDEAAQDVLLDLHPAAAVQEGLFDKKDDLRRATLMRMVDRLNTRFGRDTVTFAAAGRRRPWKLRRELLSPCYTTEWDELLRV